MYEYCRGEFAGMLTPVTQLNAPVPQQVKTSSVTVVLTLADDQLLKCIWLVSTWLLLTWSNKGVFHAIAVLFPWKMKNVFFISLSL